MTRRIAPIFAYAGTVAAATLAAALMSGKALAESPLANPPAPFVSTLSRAEVQAQLKKDRPLLTSYATEWRLQQSDPVARSDYTPQQARADYIAAREQVRAMTGEDSGSSYLARMRPRIAPPTYAAAGPQR